jgi:hypothetical protein
MTGSTSTKIRPAALLVIAALLLITFSPSLTSAQTAQGATMTVLQGEVDVVHPDGSAIRPAPSGTTVNVGDKISTLSQGGAVITFFSGTEIEMGEQTTLVVERVSRQGDRIDVSLQEVFGMTLNRVQTFADPGSAYQIGAGGAIATVRGTGFVFGGPVGVLGHTFVYMVCLPDNVTGLLPPGPGKDGCDDKTSFAGSRVSSSTGYFVEVNGGAVVSPVDSFSPDFTGGVFSAGTRAITQITQRTCAKTLQQRYPPGGGSGLSGPDAQNTCGLMMSEDTTDQRNQVCVSMLLVLGLPPDRDVCDQLAYGLSLPPSIPADVSTIPSSGTQSSASPTGNSPPGFNPPAQSSDQTSVTTIIDAGSPSGSDSNKKNSKNDNDNGNDNKDSSKNKDKKTDKDKDSQKNNSGSSGGSSSPGHPGCGC